MAIRRVSFLFAALIFLGHLAPAGAQDERSLRRSINKGTVGLIAGVIDDTYMTIASDMASVLDGEDMRILAMAGNGPLHNVGDILYLRGVDIGLVQSDSLAYVQLDGSYANIENRLHYISHLYDETLHLIARADIGSVTDLAGEIVAVGAAGGKGAITARVVFDSLEISVVPSPAEGGSALELLKAGKIAAMIAVADTAAPLFASLGREDGLKFLSLPLSEALRGTYRPAVLTSEDYPGLIAQDAVIETLAVGTVLAVYNWEPDTARYAKVARFVEAFFSSLPALQTPPRHPKWQEVKPAMAVPGWIRFKPAEDWIITQTAGASGDIKQAFETFVQTQAPSIANRLASDRDKEELFRLFLLWQASRDQ